VTRGASVAEPYRKASPNWLELRREIDARSRSPALERQAADRLRDVQPTPNPTRILDLGAGAGANLLHLAPRLPLPQRWTLVDRDRELLASVPRGGPGVEIERMACDFLDPGSPVRARDGEYDLASANAVFDLVPEEGAHALARWLADRCPLALFTLHYGPETRFEPSSPGDERALALFHRHMTREQASGRAMGERCEVALPRALRDAGYEVRTEATPWRVRPDDIGILLQLISFIEDACLELMPGEIKIGEWGKDKRRLALAGRLSATVEHVDVLAWRRA